MKKYTLTITFDADHRWRFDDNDLDKLMRAVMSIKGGVFNASDFVIFEDMKSSQLVTINRKQVRTMEIVENVFVDE